MALAPAKEAALAPALEAAHCTDSVAVGTAAVAGLICRRSRAEVGRLFGFRCVLMVTAEVSIQCPVFQKAVVVF